MYKLLKIFLVIVAVFALFSMSIHGEAAKKNVAIMPIDNNSDTVQTSSESIMYKLVAENMTNQLINVFHSSESYAVIDREKVNQTLIAVGIQENVEQEQAISIGKKVNAQCSVIGKVVSAEVTENRDKNALEAIKNITGQNSEGSENPENKESNGDVKVTKSTQAGDFEGKIIVELKFLNNETGEVIFSDEITCTETGTNGANALRTACKAVAEDFISKVVKQSPLETKTETEQQTTEENTSSDIAVIYVEGDVLYIDKGNDANIKVGDIFAIFTKSVPITDMDGKVITVRTTEVGKALVTEVNKNHSICKIIKRDDSDPNAIKRGCTAKKTDE
ncbi:MAG: hypothetical protein IJ862_04395 [Selenomonadaceae bacterium]|nr:hypothetical protein [Selenomonadaceae bacterium]